MKASEFVKMMEEDIQSASDKDTLSEVLDVVKAVLAPMPEREVDGSKTVRGCYDFMYEYAKKHRNGNSYYMGPNKSMAVVGQYLGVYGDTDAGGTVPPAQPNAPVAKSAPINLDDFI